MMCAELWGAENDRIDFVEWTRKERWHFCGVKGICNTVMEDVRECVLYIGWGDSGREGSNCCMGRLLLDIGPPLSLLEHLDTVYSI